MEFEIQSAKSPWNFESVVHGRKEPNRLGSHFPPTHRTTPLALRCELIPTVFPSGVSKDTQLMVRIINPFGGFLMNSEGVTVMAIDDLQIDHD